VHLSSLFRFLAKLLLFSTAPILIVLTVVESEVSSERN